MLKIRIPNNVEKIKEQIFWLELLLKQDTQEKDRKIHQEALDTLRQELLEFEK